MKQKRSSALAWFLVLSLIVSFYTSHLLVNAEDGAATGVTTLKSFYTLGQTVEVYVQDNELAGNEQPDEITFLDVVSDTDSEGISVQLTENGDTGSFFGNILLTDEPSSLEPPAIQAGANNQVTFTFTDYSGQPHSVQIKVLDVTPEIQVQVNNPDGSPATLGDVVIKQAVGDEERFIDAVPLSPEGTCIIPITHEGDFRLIAYPDKNELFANSDTLYYHVDDWGSAGTSEGTITSAELTYRTPSIKGSITNSNGDPIQPDQYEIYIRTSNPEDMNEIHPEVICDNGVYTVLGLYDGDYTENYYIKAISRHGSDADSFEQEISYNDQNPSWIDLQLTTPQLTGTVTVVGGENDGSAVAGGCVALFDENHNYMHGFYMPPISPDGTFRIGGLYDGVYYIQASPFEGNYEALDSIRIEIQGGVYVDSEGQPISEPISLTVEQKALRLLRVENRARGDNRYEFILKNFTLLQTSEDWSSFEAHITGQGEDFTTTQVYLDPGYMDFGSEECRMFIDVPDGIQVPYGQYQIDLTYKGEPVPVQSSNSFIVGAYVNINPIGINPGDCGSITLTGDAREDQSGHKEYNWAPGDTLEADIHSQQGQGFFTCDVTVNADSTLSFVPPAGLSQQNDGWKTFELFNVNEGDRVYIGRGDFEMGTPEVLQVLAYQDSNTVFIRGNYLTRYINQDTTYKLYVDGIETAPLSQDVNNFWGEWDVSFHDFSFTAGHSYRLVATANDGTVYDGDVQIVPQLNVQNPVIRYHEMSDSVSFEDSGSLWSAGDPMRLRIRTPWGSWDYDSGNIPDMQLTVNEDELVFIRSGHDENPDNDKVFGEYQYGAYTAEVINAEGRTLGYSPIYIVANTDQVYQGQVQLPESDTGFQSYIHIGKTDDDNWGKWILTDAAGRFNFSAFDLNYEGTYYLEAYPKDSADYTVSSRYEFTVAPNNDLMTPSNQIVKLRSPILTVHVEMPDGPGEARGVVEFTKIGDNEQHQPVQLMIGQGGLALLPTIEDGTYTVTAYPDYEIDASASQRVILIVSDNQCTLEGESTPIEEMTLTFKSIQLVGDVTYPDGNSPVHANDFQIWTMPVAGVPQNAQEPFFNYRDGVYKAGGFSTGTYRITLVSNLFDYADGWYDVTITDPDTQASLPLAFTAPQIKGHVVDPQGQPILEGWIGIQDENRNYLGGTGIWGDQNGGYRIGSLQDGTYFLNVELPHVEGKDYPPYEGTFSITIDGGVCTSADAMNMTLQLTERKPKFSYISDPIKGAPDLQVEIRNASQCIGDGHEPIALKFSGLGHEAILIQYEELYYDDFRDKIMLKFDFSEAKDFPYGEYTLSLYEGATNGVPLHSITVSLSCRVVVNPRVVPSSGLSGATLHLDAERMGDQPLSYPWNAGDTVRVHIESFEFNEQTQQPVFMYDKEVTVSQDQTIDVTVTPQQGEQANDGGYIVQLFKPGPEIKFLGSGGFEVGDTQIREIMAYEADKAISIKGDFLNKYQVPGARLELYVDGDFVTATTDVNNNWGDLQWFIPVRVNSHNEFTVKLFANNELVPLADDRVHVVPLITSDDYILSDGDTIALNASEVTGKGWLENDNVTVRIRSELNSEGTEGQIVSSGALTVTDDRITFPNTGSTQTEPINQDNPGATFPLQPGAYIIEVFNEGMERIGMTEIFAGSDDDYILGVVKDENGNPAGGSMVRFESTNEGDKYRLGFSVGADGVFVGSKAWLPNEHYKTWAEAPYYATGANSEAAFFELNDGGFNPDYIELQLTKPQVKGVVRTPSNELLRQGDITISKDGEVIASVPIAVDGSYKISGLDLNEEYELIAHPYQEREELMWSPGEAVIISEETQTVDLSVRAAHKILGSVVLPNGKTAPEGGLELSVAAKDNNGTPDVNEDDQYYVYVVEMPEGAHAWDYEIKVPDGEGPYIVVYWADVNSGYIPYGNYSTTGTVYSEEEATGLLMNNQNKTGIDLFLKEGRVISGTLDIDEEAENIPDNMKIRIVAIMDNATDFHEADDYVGWTEVTLSSESPTADFTLRVPENPVGKGYRLEYELYDTGTQFASNGYYTSQGTVLDYPSHERIDVRSGNALNKNLTVLKKEAPAIMYAKIDETGSKLIVYFSKEMKAESMSAEGFSLTADSMPVALGEGSFHPGDQEDSDVYYTIPTQDILLFADDQNLRLSYDGNHGIESGDDMVLEAFADKTVENKSNRKLQINGVVPNSLNNRNLTVSVAFAGIDLFIKEGESTLAAGTGSASTQITGEGVHTLTIGSPKKLKSVTLSFTIDKTAPQVVLSNSDSVTNNAAGVTPTVTVNGEYIENTLSLTLNGARYTAGTPIRAPGHYVLIASAKDAAGNIGTARKEFDIIWDMQAPVISSNLVSGSYYEQITPAVSLSGGSNSAQYAYTTRLVYPNGTVQAYAQGQALPSLSAIGGTPNPEGLYRLEIRATNPSYNDVVSEKTYTFTLDGQSPSITIAGITDNARYNTPVTPSISLSDTVATQQVLMSNATISLTRNGAAVAAYKPGDSIQSDGLYVLSVQTEDLVHHTASMSRTFTVDRTKPVISVTGVVDGVTYNDTNVTMTAVTNEGTLTVTSNGQPLTLDNNQAVFTGTPGEVVNYRVILQATDETQNVSQKEITFTIDRQPVNIVINGIREGQLVNYSPIIGVTVYEGTVEKTGAVATLDGLPYLPIVPIPDGTHTFKVTYKEGDTTTIKTVSFTVDKTAPQISNVTLYKNSQAVSANTFVRSGDVLTIKVRITETNGVSEVGFNLGSLAVKLPMVYNEVSGLYEGVLRVGSGDTSAMMLSLYARDKAGNEIAYTAYPNSVTLDNTKPVVAKSTTPSAPDGNNGVFRFQGTTVTLTAASTDTVYYVFNGTPGQATGSKILTPAQGDNILVYYAVDQAGNASDEKVYVFKFDSQKPANVVLTSPQSALVNTPKVSLSGMVAGEGQSTRVVISNVQTGEIVSIASLKNDGSFTLNDVSLKENQNSFALYAIDYAGNISAAAAPFFRTLDSTAPIMTLEKITDTEYTLTSNEPVTGVWAKFNGVLLDSEAISGSGTSYTITVPEPVEGINTLNLWALDLAGNTGTGSFTSTYIPANTAQENLSVGEGTTMDIPADAFDQEIQMLVRTVDISGDVGYKPITAPVSFDFTNTSGSSVTAQAPILIRIQIGLGLRGVMLMHINDNGEADEPVPAIEATSALDLATIPVDTPYYLTDTGELVFRTANFSAYSPVVDNTAPVINVSSSSRTVNKADYEEMDNKIVLEGAISDSSAAFITKVLVDGEEMDLSGIAAGDLDSSFSIDLPALSDGYHEVSLIAQDSVDNQSDMKTITYTVDIHAPALTVTSPASLTRQSTVNLGIQTDETVSIYINSVYKDQNLGSFSIPVTLDHDGPSPFIVKAVDALGNETTAPTIVITRDATAPQITITGVADNDVYGAAVTIGVDVQDYDTLEIEMDGASYAPGVYSTEGQHELSVTAVDSVGNVASQVISFTIDASVPTINYSGVMQNGLYDVNKTLSVTTLNADSLKITKVVNGGAAQVIDVEGSSTTVDLTAANNEQNTYVIQISAKKTVGGQVRSASTSLQVTIDKKAPGLTVSASSQTEAATATLSGSVDEISDIYLNGQLAIDNQQAGSFTLAGQALILGDNTFTVKAVDRVGHDTTKTVTIKRVAPANDDPEDDGNDNPGGIPTAPGNIQPGIAVSGSTITSIPVIASGKATSTLSETDIKNAMNNAKADQNGVKTVKIDISGRDGIGTYTLGLPASIMASGSANQSYVMNTSLASITLPGNMFKAGDTGSHTEMGLSVSTVDKSGLSKDLKDKIGNRPLIELTALADGKAFSWQNESAPVTIALDYTPTAEELKDINHIVVWYIDGNGKVIEVPSGRYDPATKKVIFTVTHFSKYAVAYANRTFSDIGTAYGKASIEVLASKGFYPWLTGNSFNPNRSITRAEFIYLVMTALNLHAEFDTSFTDAKPTDYFYQAAGAAKKLGVTVGIGNNRLGGDLSITRQDMATIIYNAIKAAKKNYQQGTVNDLKQFKDFSKIASYSQTSLATLVKSGILVGNNQIIDPQGHFTMQQAAVVIFKLYQLP